MLEDKVILITGGTGSFGNAVLKGLLETNVKEIRIFSRDEKKQDDMRLALQNERVKFYIGDVRNTDSVSDAVFGSNYVFHAAALKQVPSCDFYPMEAVRTNILGAENVMRSAIEHKVEKCVVLSTDKAVYPINAMGMSKALMEKLMVSKSRFVDTTTLCATRYGNVMCSRGSVIPLFIDQILKKNPITITDPKMTRFLMSLEESVKLVLYAFKNAEGGDIFIQKSPAATIYDLAIALNEIFDGNGDIRIIGTRHGEKLYESLVSREEMARAVSLDNFYKVPSDDRDLNYSNFFSQGGEKISSSEDYTSHNTKRLSIDEIKSVLMEQPYVREMLNDR